MTAWKIGPALAAGCSIVLKPAKETSLTSLKIAELAFEAGISAGVFNVLPGGGKEVGEPIGMHMVSFTGSTVTGKLFLHYAADSNLKRIVLECGGKNPAIALDDIEDMDKVAENIINGAFWNMGENCSATSRLIVHHSVKDKLLERMLVHLKDWKMGDPLDPKNKLGSLVSKAHFEKVAEFIKQAHTESLTIVAGGQAHNNIFVEPTIVDNVATTSKLFNEEIFGPVLSITTFSDINEAITLANDTPYGLAASIYTSSLRHALKLSQAVRAGTVSVNCFGEGDATTAFWGV